MGASQATLEAIVETKAINYLVYSPTDGPLRSLALERGQLFIGDLSSELTRAEFEKVLGSAALDVAYVNTARSINHFGAMGLTKLPTLIHYQALDRPNLDGEQAAVVARLDRVTEVCSSASLDPLPDHYPEVPSGLSATIGAALANLADARSALNSKPNVSGCLKFGRKAEEGRKATPREAALIRALGQSPRQYDGEVALSELDWQKFGVDVPYLMLITGRCGSTWLTRLMDRSGQLGNPNEFFNEAEVLKERSSHDHFGPLSQYFEQVVRRHTVNGRFGLQIDPSRFLGLSRIIDWDAMFPKHSQFFYMHRRNLVLQAYSYLQAKETGHWHAYETDVEINSSDAPTVDEVKLWSTILDIIESENAIRHYYKSRGIQPIEIVYEDLVANPEYELVRIATNLGVDPDAVFESKKSTSAETIPISHRGKNRFLTTFFSKYRNATELIHHNRESLNSYDVSKLLLPLGIDTGRTLKLRFLH